MDTLTFEISNCTHFPVIEFSTKRNVFLTYENMHVPDIYLS